MQNNIQIISPREATYPPLLRETHDPPQQLYIRGNVELLSSPNLLAVVGSRKANLYGKQAIEKLLPPIISAGVTIVSGMAYGIDTLGHQACVENKAPTIAVMGTGIDDESLYPQHNKKLAHTILENGGTLISEYEPKTPALPHHFPERNRIIAGLCPATLIIQAAQKSGSLITGRLALEANRDVCAVPGPITDPLCAGTNELIQNGATPILTPEDLLELYDITPSETTTTRQQELSQDQATIIKQLSHEPQHIDQLIIKLDMPSHKVAALLLELELAGHVKQVGGMKYIRPS